MSEHSDHLIEMLDKAAIQYYRIVLAIGSSESDRTFLLRETGDRLSVPVLNCNLELSRRLLDVPVQQRPLQVARLMEDVVSETAGDCVLLDHTELLFDVSLKLDPLRLLQNLARNRTVVAAWNGIIEDNRLIYARQDHPEYRHYPIQDFLYVDLEALSSAM